MRKVESVEFRIDFARGTARSTSPWWRDGKLIQIVLEALARRDLWLDFGQHAPPRGASTTFASRPDLLREAPAWSSGSHVLSADPKGNPGRSYVALGLQRGAFDLFLAVIGDDMASRRSTLLQSLVDFTVDVCAALGDGWTLGFANGAWAVDFDYPRERPPREFGDWVIGALLNVVQLSAWTAEDAEEDRRATGKRLSEASRLPAGARREERGTLSFFRWVPHLGDDARTAAALASQERWTAKTLDPPIANGWNEQGDQRLWMVTASKREDVSLYDTAEEHGYLVVAARDDGSTDPKALARAAQWGKAGKLPDGTPLAGIGLIVTSRKAAVALFQKGLPDGVQDVLFTSDDGSTFWNPFPPGLWAR
jgi:hypothetical protein